MIGITNTLRLFILGLMTIPSTMAVSSQSPTPNPSQKLFCSDCYLGKVKFLAKPAYPAAARSINASGKVEVSIVIGPDGKVSSAIPISGHPFLRAAAVKAALESEFEPFRFSINDSPVYGYGVITYNFISDRPAVTKTEFKASLKNEAKKIPYIETVDCLDCKEFIISRPTPSYPSYVGTGPHIYNGKVSIGILIDETGKVKSARAIAGHPYFRPMLEKASLTAVFRPKIINGVAHEDSGIIVYQVVSRKSKEKYDTWLPIINGMADYLPTPESPTHYLCVDGRVEVEVLVNKSGRVVTALAKRGNPLLYSSAVKAAEKARFKLPDHLPKIQTRGILVYNFPRAANCPVR